MCKNIFNLGLDNLKIYVKMAYVVDAALAHPVERHLAKVEVASSSLVSRSIKAYCESDRLFYNVLGVYGGKLAAKCLMSL